MHMLLHLKFLGLALLTSSTLALTIQQGTNLVNPTNSLHTNSNLNGTVAADPKAFVCVKKGTSTATTPKNADCAGALRALPLNPNVGVFYEISGGNFQLPYFTKFKTCTVLITLRSKNDKVQSSWLAVQVAAMELNAACEDARGRHGFDELLKANTYVDDLEAMKITLQPSSFGDGYDETNATATA